MPCAVLIVISLDIRYDLRERLYCGMSNGKDCLGLLAFFSPTRVQFELSRAAGKIVK